MPNFEKPKKKPDSLRETLHKEMKEHMAFHETREDSIAYKYATKALESFAERGLGAANAVERELDRQKTLQIDDPRKMPPEEIVRWERMLTEVETWTLTIPNLLQQSRVVQHNPLVQDQLLSIFRLIHQRDQMLDAMDGLRFRALKGSDKNPFSPFQDAVPPEFYELAVIATTQWFIRENVRIHPQLLNPAKRGDLQLHVEALQILADTEHEGEWKVDKAQPLDSFIRSKFGSAFFRKTAPDQQAADERLTKLFEQGRVRVNGVVEKTTPSRNIKPGDTISVVTAFYVSTERVGVGLDSAIATTQDERRELNAERVTQNLPAAAEFAFNVRDSMDVWRRLLIEVGGEKDRKRYAGQLSTDIQRFNEDFMQKKSLEEFKQDAQRQLEEAKRDNKKAKMFLKFFTFFLGDTPSDRLTTSPEELQEVFDKVMKKAEKGYEDIATPENSNTIEELDRLLKRMQDGEVVDPLQLKKYLTEYGKIILQAGHTMSMIQAWQITENVQRVGGTGESNNLELTTRVDNKTASQWASGFSPYGSLKTLSYTDKDGRIIIVDPGPSFSERSWSHIWETGKLGAQNAALSVVLTHIFTKIHYLVILAPGLHGFVKAAGNKLAGPATAVILAELTMYQSKEAARYERMKIAAKIVEESVQGLQKLHNDKKATLTTKEIVARKYASKIRSELSVLLHASQGESDIAQITSGNRDTDIRPDLFLEAHVYTNQLLTATGFPPSAELNASGKGSLPESVDALRQQVKEMGYDPKISPEVIAYLESRLGDESLVKDRLQIDRMRRELEELKVSTRSDLGDLRGHVERKPRKSKMQRIIDGDEYPSGDTVAEQSGTLRDASLSSEMDREYAQRTSTEKKREELLEYALEVILFDHEIKMELKGNVKYKGKPGYELIGWIPGPHQYIPAEYKGDQRHIISRSKLDEWNNKAQRLVHVPMGKVLATARYLDKNAPSSDAVEGLLSSTNADKIQKLAGGRAMESEFRARWSLLRQYADKYAPPETAQSKEPVMVFDENAGLYRGELKEGNAIIPFTVKPLGSGKSYSSARLTHPSKANGYIVKIEGEKTWTIWGGTFFDNKGHSEAIRKKMRQILTMPYRSEERGWASIDRVMGFYPQDSIGHSKLHKAVDPLLKESFQKQSFLRELMRAITLHGGKITKDNWKAIHEEMRLFQELGGFGYSPHYEKR